MFIKRGKHQLHPRPLIAGKTAVLHDAVDQSLIPAVRFKVDPCHRGGAVSAAEFTVSDQEILRGNHGNPLAVVVKTFHVVDCHISDAVHINSVAAAGPEDKPVNRDIAAGKNGKCMPPLRFFISGTVEIILFVHSQDSSAAHCNIVPAANHEKRLVEIMEPAGHGSDFGAVLKYDFKI